MDWKKYWNKSISEDSLDDFCKQVGRTWKKKNYSDQQIEYIIKRIKEFLPADNSKKVLELACGNGMITYSIAPYYKSVTAIDYSAPLINIAIKKFARENIDYWTGNALALDHLDDGYDYVLIYFAFQYFTPKEADLLFKQLDRLLKPGGLIFLGEVADGDRIWNFYRGIKGRFLYYFHLLQNKKIIGYWWKPKTLLYICRKYDWELSVFYQNKFLPNHYFRYDALIQKPGLPTSPK